MRTIEIIGIPLDLGQARRGVDMGPSALRYAGLSSKLAALGYYVEDYGNIAVPVREHLPPSSPIEYSPYIEQVCKRAYDTGKAALKNGRIPVFLGGDHSISIGTIGAVTHEQSAGVIWFDGHGDFNLPKTSPNGNIHGMPLSILLGYGIPELVNCGRQGAKLRPNDVVLVGVRDLDYDERGLLKKSGIRIYTMREIDERGIAAVMTEAAERLSRLGRIHVSLDMDVIDPLSAPGVGTPAPGGLTYREAHLAMEILADSRLACSMDIVEINPIIDDRNTTALMAAGLAASFLGKKIL
ncbi:MAG: arginase [Chitinispirillales bacterium]|jgi:arginase|nr:arginase [Chitinispirillales bacterium]